ncbi:PREDICTED: uncharacterized protein LOC104812594 [Tarenaya hassleriana]|uniref:uncharacterized protein LOC104812594 n=1 Tax=Tarenaya hassleriana TaxID=28532 RepID=UPI00053C78E9|nr:PREDICTED: uncharacterized protein LOC104812594 [Tarenaya hassleriana]
MPPSPALRCSPVRELPGKNHRRGHSIEYGILFKEKDDDDDLALFSEVQNKERENFLLESSDDLEDAFSSKLKHFSESTILVQGESSGLLNADGDKNDYDWLLTPPDTPLFPSLDDEPPSASSPSRGRPRGQISLSRSSTMERSHQSSKGSASPNRLSMSPQSGSMHQMKGRTSSTHQSSPTSAQPAAIPVRRTSPSPSKSSRPASRSSTPNSRRLSTWSNTMASTALRGTSPSRSSHGSSSSPKIKAWQSNIPEFSLDAPPNLRTSLADRPASYVRGSSPASRIGRDSSSRHNRQSVSPIASRSVSSSHSHERDRFSSHSKGSVASSGDDDLDSLQSIPLSGSDRPVSKRTSLSPSNRTPRSSKLLSPSSAPKKPFESALRQMDQRKGHRNMFRPLVSSVPCTGLYAGKDSSSYHHIILRPSTSTVGGSADFGRVTGFIPGTKGSELLCDCHTENETLQHPNTHEEISALDIDLLSKGNRSKNHDSPLHNLLGCLDQGNATECNAGVSEEVNHRVDVDTNSTSGNLPVAGDVPEGVALENLEACSRCGFHYYATEPVESEINLCPDCREQHDFAETALLRTTVLLAENSLNTVMTAQETLPQPIETQENITQGQNSCEEGQNYLQENTVSEALTVGDGERSNHQHEIHQPSSDCNLLDRDTDGTKTLFSDKHCDLKIDSSDGGRSSLLIKRSSSMKAPTTRAKNSNAINRSYEDFSFVRERSNRLRSSTEHATLSASPSSDFGSSVQKEAHVQQRSGNTHDVGCHRYDINSRSLSSMSSSSEVSGHVGQAPSVRLGASSELFAVDMISTDDQAHPESHPKIQDSGNKEADVMYSAFGESRRSIGISSLELSRDVVGTVAESNSVASLNNDGNKDLYEAGDGEAKNLMSTMESGESPVHVRSTSELGALSVATVSSFEDDSLLQGSIYQEKEGNEISEHGLSATSSEIELEKCEHEHPGSEGHDIFLGSECNRNELEDCSDLCSLGKDARNSAMEHNASAPANGSLENSTVIVECHEGREPKSLTLEEATDTILFCSSIVHDLAYRAATLAIEKQGDVAMEDSGPTVMILGKSNTYKVHKHSGTKVKHSSKSTKGRQKQMETDLKGSIPMENDENGGETVTPNVGVMNKGDSLNPPKLESKCNCSIM